MAPFSVACSEGLRNLLIRVVLTQCVHRPNGGRHPSDQRDLQEQAKDTRERPPDREKREPGKQ